MQSGVIAMRMRRKKHLNVRLAACGEIVTSYWPEELAFSVWDDGSDRLDFAAVFGNDNPIEMEIGCGKGGFICELARRHPDVNFIAVEKSESALVIACEKAQALGLSNVHFISTDAEYLPRILPHGFARRIYLNFSCPYPKKRYASHRLTDRHFLLMYRSWLTPKGDVRQKTDDPDLFAFSISSLSSAGFIIADVILDLHHSNIDDNIVTEYESRFLAQGKSIFYLRALVSTDSLPMS